MNGSGSKRRRGIASILRPYWGFVTLLALFTIGSNGLALAIPKLIAYAIDSYSTGAFDGRAVSIEFFAIAFVIFICTYLQGVTETYIAERSARDMRAKLVDKISRLSYSGLESETEGRLLTNLTSDMDAIKLFISMAVVNIIAAAVLIPGSMALLISTDWQLALSILALLPIAGIVFFAVFRRLGPLFRITQAIIDRLNAVIGESIVGSAIVRVLDSEDAENRKFEHQNAAARDNGIRVVKLFSIMIPTVGILTNLSILLILALGGHFVIAGTMTIGSLAAFNSYVFILIFPIVMLGFISNIVSRAQASYDRILHVFDAPEERASGPVKAEIRGDISIEAVTVAYGERRALKDVSIDIRAGSKTAIIGPTAAGKTQLLYAIMGLIKPTEGRILYDGRPIAEYDRESFHSQVAIVFQDSVMFNMSLRENIGFGAQAIEESVRKAIETAELADFVAALPEGLETIVSERGTSLSGGQKQRIMLARALALDPKVLLLDDFTARVDAATEAKILENVSRNYPSLTLVSVTQKIRSIERFDEIVLLMEGEAVARGTHEELVRTSPEYNQILESQKSTQAYE